MQNIKNYREKNDLCKCVCMGAMTVYMTIYSSTVMKNTSLREVSQTKEGALFLGKVLNTPLKPLSAQKHVNVRNLKSSVKFHSVFHTHDVST